MTKETSKKQSKKETKKAATAAKTKKQTETKKADKSKPTKSAKKTAAAKTTKATKKQADQKTVSAESTEKKTTTESSSKSTKNASATNPQTMEELLANADYSLTIPQKGETVTGVITNIGKKSVSIDIGGKTEGLVVDKEFGLAKEYVVSLNEGDEIEAQVTSEENNQGQVLLSLKRAAMDARWVFFTKAMEDKTVLEAKGIDVNKGGLIVLVNGVRGFVPSSQFGKKLVGKYMQLKGQKIKVMAIEVDREKNRLIFSERHVSEAEEIAQKSQALEAVKVNEIYEGVVSGVMPFGLFVTVEVPVDSKAKEEDSAVGQVEGLVHISEISWEKVSHPRDYSSVGDRIKVRVLGLDERTNKLNLSIKQLSDDPWVDIDKRYEIGTSVSGKVSRVEPFGVFVNVEPGVDGLIHSSKLDTNTELKKGDTVTVNVESVDPEQRRMSLSLVLTELPVGYK